MAGFKRNNHKNIEVPEELKEELDDLADFQISASVPEKIKTQRVKAKENEDSISSSDEGEFADLTNAT